MHVVCAFRRRVAALYSKQHARLSLTFCCSTLLVLDEPTDQLDLFGIEALERVLRAWPGGLVMGESR
jgi:ATPase subunit of ABC transporter with duplicated ATPase domains